MQKTRRYLIDGLVIDIPIRFDEPTGFFIESYPNFKDAPIYTPNGHHLTVAVMDACDLAKPMAEGACTDCSDCSYFQRAGERTLFGVCMCKQWRKSSSERMLETEGEGSV